MARDGVGGAGPIRPGRPSHAPGTAAGKGSLAAGVAQLHKEHPHPTHSPRAYKAAAPRMNSGVKSPYKK